MNNISAGANRSLTLQVNRLSGDVPSVLLNMINIDILNGNLFRCNFKRNTLPQHDKSFKIYQCGSDSFDQSMIAWTVLLFVSLSLVLIGVYWIQHLEGGFERMTSVRLTKDLIARLSEYHAKVRQPEYNLAQFGAFSSYFRYIMLLLTLLVLVVGLPMYEFLTSYYKTVSVSYAWILSASFLSGTVPALWNECPKDHLILQAQTK
eukprot:gene32106-39652_t